MDDTKVLMIVDDDRDDRFFFSIAVKDLGTGFECIEAQHALDALEQLEKAERLPDFIFLDLNMPQMTGKDFLALLKKDARFKEIPVIIYSTSDYWKDLEETNKLGASYYLTKTWDVLKLPELISVAMGKAAPYKEI
jgi:CheY-like chemotaxis protein